MIASGDSGASGPRAGREGQGPPVLGIDLGTTYSLVAHLDRLGRPTSIPNAEGELLTPSVVLLDAAGPVVGREALRAAATEPGKVAECVKRDMGSRAYHRPVDGRSLPPEVLSSYILRRLRADAARKLGPVSHAVITVPAYFDEPRRRATADAGRLAGLEVPDVHNEPTAAALAYGHQEGYLDESGGHPGDRPLRVLVYDLGGGTFDVTIVEIAGTSFRVVATDGDVRLGGKDWDERLVALAAERFRAAHREDPLAHPESLQDLYQAAEATKRTLSARPQAALVINHLGTRLRVVVTREEFERATAALLGRTRATTQIVLQQSGLGWGEIDRVLLVGGSTRMPMVTGMIEELSGRPPDLSMSADEAVAHGAALYADLLARHRGLIGGPSPFSLADVNSHSLGVAGVDRRTGRAVNRVLIPKNTPLPHAVAGRFKTARACQGSVRIRVLEGESEHPDACTEVGTCVLRGLPVGLPAGSPVEVRYAYDAGGRLVVSARLPGQGVAVAAEFVRDGSLSVGDLLLWGERLADEANRLDW